MNDLLAKCMEKYIEYECSNSDNAQNKWLLFEIEFSNLVKYAYNTESMERLILKSLSEVA